VDWENDVVEAGTGAEDEVRVGVLQHQAASTTNTFPRDDSTVNETQYLGEVYVR
jgi:hypothetical protein